MTINGWNISNASAKQFNVIWGYSEITNKSQWVERANNPVVFDSITGFKPLRIVMVVYGNSREAIRGNISTVLSKLLKPSTIVLDGFTHKFYGYLRAHSAEETAKKRWHVLTLDLEGYEFSSEVSVSGSTSINVNNPGTLTTPAVVTIVPSAGMSSLTITGLGDTITLTGVESGKTIVINGETGLITQNNALRDADLYSMPVVKPGANVVACNRSQATITVAFKPRYM